MKPGDIVFTRDFVKHVKIMALRRGTWFRLHRDERAIIDLTINTIKYIRSKVLREIIIKIIEKISPKLLYMYKAYQIGLKILEKRIQQAKIIGYKKINKIKKDIKYIIYLGTWYLNTSPIYRPNIEI